MTINGGLGLVGRAREKSDGSNGMAVRSQPACARNLMLSSFHSTPPVNATLVVRALLE